MYDITIIVSLRLQSNLQYIRQENQNSMTFINGTESDKLKKIKQNGVFASAYGVINTYIKTNTKMKYLKSKTFLKSIQITEK